eukprot:XP_001697572.1 predicted protein [Chlamydomonas reinhardtii]
MVCCPGWRSQRERERDKARAREPPGHYSEHVGVYEWAIVDFAAQFNAAEEKAVLRSETFRLGSYDWQLQCTDDLKDDDSVDEHEEVNEHIVRDPLFHLERIITEPQEQLRPTAAGGGSRLPPASAWCRVAICNHDDPVKDFRIYAEHRFGRGHSRRHCIKYKRKHALLLATITKPGSGFLRPDDGALVVRLELWLEPPPPCAYPATLPEDLCPVHRKAAAGAAVASCYCGEAAAGLSADLLWLLQHAESTSDATITAFTTRPPRESSGGADAAGAQGPGGGPAAATAVGLVASGSGQRGLEAEIACSSAAGSGGAVSGSDLTVPATSVTPAPAAEAPASNAAALEVSRRTFPVHRGILAARCPYFRALFDSGMADSGTRDLTLPDTHPAALEALLGYLYGGRLELPSRELARSCLQLADVLLLQPAADMLTRHLVATASPDSFVADLLLASGLGGEGEGGQTQLLTGLLGWRSQREREREKARAREPPGHYSEHVGVYEWAIVDFAAQFNAAEEKAVLRSETFRLGSYDWQLQCSDDLESDDSDDEHEAVNEHIVRDPLFHLERIITKPQEQLRPTAAGGCSRLPPASAWCRVAICNHDDPVKDFRIYAEHRFGRGHSRRHCVESYGPEHALLLATITKPGSGFLRPDDGALVVRLELWLEPPPPCAYPATLPEDLCPVHRKAAAGAAVASCYCGEAAAGLSADLLWLLQHAESTSDATITAFTTRPPWESSGGADAAGAQGPGGGPAAATAVGLVASGSGQRGSEAEIACSSAAGSGGAVSGSDLTVPATSVTPAPAAEAPASNAAALGVSRRTFPVHRGILAARCPYFRALFDSGMADSGTRDLTLPDTHPAALEALLGYLYGGRLELPSRELARSCLQLADVLLLQPAADMLTRHLTYYWPRGSAAKAKAARHSS